MDRHVQNVEQRVEGTHDGEGQTMRVAAHREGEQAAATKEEGGHAKAFQLRNLPQFEVDRYDQNYQPTSLADKMDRLASSLPADEFDPETCELQKEAVDSAPVPIFAQDIESDVFDSEDCELQSTAVDSVDQIPLDHLNPSAPAEIRAKQVANISSALPGDAFDPVDCAIDKETASGPDDQDEDDAVPDVTAPDHYVRLPADRFEPDECGVQATTTGNPPDPSLDEPTTNPTKSSMASIPKEDAQADLYNVSTHTADNVREYGATVTEPSPTAQP